jgi:hypothetical protein
MVQIKGRWRGNKMGMEKALDVSYTGSKAYVVFCLMEDDQYDFPGNL